MNEKKDSWAANVSLHSSMFLLILCMSRCWSRTRYSIPVTQVISLLQSLELFSEGQSHEEVIWKLYGHSTYWTVETHSPKLTQDVAVARRPCLVPCQSIKKKVNQLEEFVFSQNKGTGKFILFVLRTLLTSGDAISRSTQTQSTTLHYTYTYIIYVTEQTSRPNQLW